MSVGDINSDAPGTGARYNSDKVPYELVPTHLLESTAQVFGYGARKYAPWNWAKGMNYSVVIGCLKRHIAAIERGEDYDEESGQRHLGHLICNALMLEHYMNEYPHLDDRPTRWFNNKESKENEGLEACGNADERDVLWPGADGRLELRYPPGNAPAYYGEVVRVPDGYEPRGYDQSTGTFYKRK